MPTLSLPVEVMKQGKRTNFVVSVKISELLHLTALTVHSDYPPERRAQRELNRAHARKFAAYLEENPDDFVVPPIMLCLESAEFIPNARNPEIGELKFNSTTQSYLIDGQHRFRGFEILRGKNPKSEILDCHIVLIIYVGLNLQERQNLFIKVNTTAKKVPASTVVTIGSSPVSKLTRAVVEAVPAFRSSIEKTRPRIPAKSSQLFTVLAIRRAVLAITADLDKAGDQDRSWEAKIEEVSTVMSALSSHMPIWTQIRQGAVHLREDTYACHPLVLEALTTVAYDLYLEQPERWEKILKRIIEVDFTRRRVVGAGSIFSGLVTDDGRLIDRRNNFRILVSKFSTILSPHWRNDTA